MYPRSKASYFGALFLEENVWSLLVFPASLSGSAILLFYTSQTSRSHPPWSLFSHFQLIPLSTQPTKFLVKACILQCLHYHQTLLEIPSCLILSTIKKICLVSLCLLITSSKFSTLLPEFSFQKASLMIFPWFHTLSWLPIDLRIMINQSLPCGHISSKRHIGGMYLLYNVMRMAEAHVGSPPPVLQPLSDHKENIRPTKVEGHSHFARFLSSTSQTIKTIKNKESLRSLYLRST